MEQWLSTQENRHTFHLIHTGRSEREKYDTVVYFRDHPRFYYTGGSYETGYDFPDSLYIDFIVT